MGAVESGHGGGLGPSGQDLARIICRKPIFLDGGRQDGSGGRGAADDGFPGSMEVRRWWWQPWCSARPCLHARQPGGAHGESTRTLDSILRIIKQATLQEARAPPQP